jgi:hypothetical protein
MRNEAKELIGINKMCSKINLILENNAVETTFFNQVDGDIFPEKSSQKTQEN